MNLVKLALRGDDAGMAEFIDEAIEVACLKGVLGNVSIMPAGPNFVNAVERFSRLANICLGVHLAINGEWQGARLSPVASQDEVESLVDRNGFFYPETQDNYLNNYVIDEIVVELKAQIDKAREYGLDIKYVDEHMCFGWLPGVSEAVRALAERENLLYADDVTPLPRANRSVFSENNNPLPGIYRWITHPALNHEDGIKLFANHKQTGANEVVKSRYKDFKLLTSSSFAESIVRMNIELIQFSDLIEAKM